jgi:putative spermidine/putrescine transport system ATP-binding protein
MSDSFLSVRQVRKVFGPTVVVQEFNLDVRQGEFVSFLGPSGCGKTTMLRIVAGFEEPSAGSVFIGGKDVTGLKPNQRNIGMVFQAYALFPNMTVAQNIGFGLKVAGKPSTEIRGRVAEMLQLIKLPEFGDRYPYQLSGGQQQRVALARAMAPRPQVLLLDEPLSALDAKVRVSLREEIRAIQKELGITTIFVTHDQEEALSMSDRIVVMYNGRAEQVGAPFEIYNRPATRFVAGFVGTLNVIEGTVADRRPRDHPGRGDFRRQPACRPQGGRGGVAGAAARGNRARPPRRPRRPGGGRHPRGELPRLGDPRARGGGRRAPVARHLQHSRQPAAGGRRDGRDQLRDGRPAGAGRVARACTPGRRPHRQGTIGARNGARPLRRDRSRVMERPDEQRAAPP